MSREAGWAGLARRGAASSRKPSFSCFCTTEDCYYRTTRSPGGYSWVTFDDARGNRLSSTDALNHITSFIYDVMNRLTKITQPDLTATNFAYDTRGRRISVTDANNKTTTYGYDDADRLLSVTDAASNQTSYGYDTENHLQAITDASNRVTSFTYDPLGRVTDVTFPSALSESYTYDAVGNLLTKTDRKGQTIDYAYDNLYRLATKSYPDSTSVAYTYDALSRLTQAVDPTGTYTFAYDNLGRLTGTTTHYSFLAGRTLTESYGYDAASNRTSFTDPESGVTNYGYDTLNRLTGLTDFSHGNSTFGYDALGRRTSLARPNGVSTSYSYDTLSRLLQALHQKGTTLVESAAYAYDAAGNRTSRTETTPGKHGTSTKTDTYSYDAIYELTQAATNGNTTDSNTYDAVGNRLTDFFGGTYSYNNSNELTSYPAYSWTYDNNGNTTAKTVSGSTTTYNWDFENRLTSVVLPGTGGTVSFKSDPFGRRIYKSSSSGTAIYAYDGDNVAEQLNSSGTAIARYTQGLGIDEPLEVFEGNASYYYHADGLGSIVALTKSNGSAVNTYFGYNTFGGMPAPSETVANPFRYTGRDFDSETGLYYYRARYYDSLFGRFLSEDPIGFEGGVNFYSYVGNSPVGTADPTGFAAQCKTPLYCSPSVLKAIMSAYMRAITQNAGFTASSAESQVEAGFPVEPDSSGGFQAGTIIMGDRQGSMKIPLPTAAGGATFHTHMSGNGMPSTPENNVTGSKQMGDTLMAVKFGFDVYVISSSGLAIASASSKDPQKGKDSGFIIQGNNFSDWFKALKKLCANLGGN